MRARSTKSVISNRVITMVSRSFNSSAPREVVMQVEAMTLNEASQWIASQTGCRKPHVSTILRWVLKGVRGEKLRAKRVGAKHWTTTQDLAQFLDVINTCSPSAETSGGQRGDQSHQLAVRRVQIDAACDHLDRLCGRPIANKPR